jgi:peptidoglycan/xylan/chitin deacetylase (PgdA/CDA1 family)
VEIASHSLTHPEPFCRLDDTTLRREIHVSRALLSDAAGEEVGGFRAPGWDLDQRVFEALGETGYRYDASSFPSPFVMFARQVAILGRTRGARSYLKLAPARAKALSPTIVPHRHSAAPLVEFPIAVTQRLRFPVYHTLSHLVPDTVFARALASLLRSSRPISYVFHAVDLLDLDADQIDPRLARHPGMRHPIERKLARLRDVLSAILRRRPVITFRHALVRELAT